jgi:adenylate kinase family enzyme
MTIPTVPADMRRIAVVGSTSSGKTTLSQALAQLLDLRHIELDALRFLPRWQVRPDEAFRELVDAATNVPRWVCDGNYGVARDLIWSRADTLVWLDYRLSLILWRLTRRTVGRTVSRTDLWNTGNRDNILKHVRLSDESLYYWVVKTYWQRKRKIPAELARPEHQHLRFVKFTRPVEADAWLAAVSAAVPSP